MNAPGKNDKTRHFWLRLAKQERTHAEENMKRYKAKGEDYSVNVYKCRMKALDLYIKMLEKQNV